MLTLNREDSFKPRVITIENCPLAIVEKGENNYGVIFGKHLITPREFYSETEARTWITLLDWVAILNVIGIYVDNAINEKNKE